MGKRCILQRLSCLVLALSLTLALATTAFSASAGDFTDVPAGAWYYDYLETACASQLIAGVTPTEFSPQGSITRAQFVTILARLDDASVSQYAEGAGEFTDVAPDGYYFPYILWAAREGLVTGITANTFAPHDNITREQAAVILARYVAAAQISIPEKGAAPNFSDSAAISPYAAEAVDALCKAGIFVGDENNNFNPQKYISRAEATVLFVRLAEASGSIETDTRGIADFSVELFKNSLDQDGKSTLISPTSVLCALAITANGANGETLAQMEKVLGLDTAQLNEYLKAYIENLPNTDKYKINIANSLWLNTACTMQFLPQFRQTAADYYGASVFERPFHEETRTEINSWVSENTDEMIKQALDRIDAEAVTYIINTLLFDAEWSTIYTEDQIRTDTFTREDGTERSTEFMFDSVYSYLSDENATGFMRHYADDKYAFVALLPQEGVSVESYVNTLTGDKLLSIIENRDHVKVVTSLPKFKNECSAEMNDILVGMGMPDAFDRDRANFTRLASGDLYISQVIHKTSIIVDERGTKAGAVTAVAMSPTSAGPDNPRYVTLDRPFVYMILDCETNLPLFIGTMMDPK